MQCRYCCGMAWNISYDITLLHWHNNGHMLKDSNTCLNVHLWRLLYPKLISSPSFLCWQSDRLIEIAQAPTILAIHTVFIFKAPGLSASVSDRLFFFMVTGTAYGSGSVQRSMGVFHYGSLDLILCIGFLILLVFFGIFRTRGASQFWSAMNCWARWRNKPPSI